MPCVRLPACRRLSAGVGVFSNIGKVVSIVWLYNSIACAPKAHSASVFPLHCPNCAALDLRHWARRNVF